MIKTTIKRTQRAILTAVALALLSGCNQLPVRNPFTTHSEPKLGSLPSLSYEEETNPKQRWSSSALSKQPRFNKLIPYVKEDRVYLADFKGHLVALNRSNGKTIWKQKTKYQFTAGPKQVGDIIVMATSDAKVVAFDAKSGDKRWQVKVTSEVLSAPNGVDNVILVHAMDGNVCGLSTQDGHKIWQLQQSTPALTLHYASSPAIVNETAMVGLANGKLLAIHLPTGQVQWERTIAIPKGRSELQRMVDISADPIVVGNHIYAITYQGKLAAVDVNSGDLIWERDLSSYQNMAYSGDYLYVTDNSHQLWAINRHNGTTFWKQTALTDRYITGPAVIDDLVVVNDRGGYMHFLTMDKGLLINRYKLSGKFYQGPISLGDALLVSNQKGKVAAIHYEDVRESA